MTRGARGRAHAVRAWFSAETTCRASSWHRSRRAILRSKGACACFGNPVRPDGSVNDGSALALRGMVHLPVGTSERVSSPDNSTRLDVSAIGDLEMFGIRMGGALGYRHAFDNGPHRQQLHVQHAHAPARACACPCR